MLINEIKRKKAVFNIIIKKTKTIKIGMMRHIL